MWDLNPLVSAFQTFSAQSFLTLSAIMVFSFSHDNHTYSSLLIKRLIKKREGLTSLPIPLSEALEQPYKVGWTEQMPHAQYLCRPTGYAHAHTAVSTAK